MRARLSLSPRAAQRDARVQVMPGSHARPYRFG
jgi:hypothetical protein